MQINLSSQFMKQYEAGSPVSGDREIATAMDKNNNVMFFSIGSDDSLYLFQKDSGTPTGWRRTNLSADLGDGVHVTHIATAQDNDGKPILAAAVYDTQFRNNPRVYFTKNFSPEATPNRWVFRGNQPGTEITHIATGADKKGNVVIVISTQKDSKMTNYLINPDVSDKSWLWREIPVPLNGKGMINLAVGHNKKLEQIDGVDAILYSLLDVDDRTTKVVLTSLPDFNLYNHEISLDFSPTALSIIEDRRGNSELFLATDKLYHLDIQAQMSRDKSDLTEEIIRIGKQKFTHTAKQIINGRYANGTLEAWVLAKDGNLYFTQEQENEGWIEPYPLDKEIGQITAWRNPHSNAIDLFTVNIDNELHHLWQDLTTTRWKNHQIMLGGVNNSIEYDSYTSQMTITDNQGFPLADKTVQVSASELTMVTINGNKYFVDAGTDVAHVKTDAMGSIVIINKVNSMTSPIIRVEAEFLDNAIDLNPNRHLENKLAQMTADDWKNARLQTNEDGVTEPLFSNTKKTDLTGTHQAIQKLIELQHKLPSQQGEINAKIPQTDLDREGVTIVTQNSPISHQIDLESLPDGYHWGLDLTGDSPVFSNQKDHIQANYMVTYNQKVASQSFLGGVFQKIEHAFGDVWRAIKRGFLKVTHLVFEKVKEGIKIVINGIEDAVHVIVKYAEQVWQVVEMVFEKIGVFFKDLVRWLGYIFKWKDILRTHDVLKNVFNQSLNHAVGQLSSAEDTVRKVFSEIKTRILGQDLSSKLGERGNQGLKRSAQTNLRNPLLASPEASWSLHHFSNGNIANGKPFTEEDLKVSLDNLGDIAEDEIKVLENAFKALGNDIVESFEHLSIGEFVKKLLIILEETIIDTIENIALGLLETAKLAVKAISVILNARWNIPVITPLYENVIAPGSKLSLLDLLSLLVAIPTTILYKIALDETPFNETQTKQLVSAKNHQELIQRLRGNPNQPPVALAALSVPASASRSSSNVVALVATTSTDTDSNPPSKGVRGATYALGFANSIATIIYGITNGIEVTASSKVTAYVKLGSGLLANAFSFTSIIVSEAAERASNQGLLAYETFITIYQAAFNVKDLLVIVFKLKNNINNALAWLETGLGGVNAGMVTALIIAEGIEGELTPSNGLKYPQNLLTSISQIISGPSTLAQDLEIKAIFLAVQEILGVIPGLVNGTRVGMDIIAQEVHRIF